MKYSQFNEERHILAALTVGDDFGGRPGRFLDIGAFDPFLYSNTRALYERGWGGVMVEPSPTPMCRLLEAYGEDRRIVLIQALVAASPILLRMMVSEDAFSTSENQNYQKWRHTVKFHGRLWIPTVSLAWLHSELGVFDFVSIDTEGTSVDLFRELVAIDMRPRCVCVEHDMRFSELDESAALGGYQCVHENTTNRIYTLEPIPEGDA